MKNCDSQILKFQRKMVKLSDDDRLDIKDKADTNRDRLKGGLRVQEKPTPIGMHTQGSYSMKTMIQEDDADYDIDDGVYFKKEDLVGPNGGEMSALDVRKMVCNALQDSRFKQAPEVRKNCVRVYYNEGFHVDVPSYRKIEIKDPISGEPKTAWELAGPDWKRSDARAVTKWFKTANSTKCSDASKDGNSGQFVRMTRLMKKFAKSRGTWKSKTISGFAISRLVEECYLEIRGRNDKAFRDLMRRIVDRLNYNDEIEHPTLKDENIVNSGSSKVSFFKECLEENLGHFEILDDPDCTHDQAMKAWDRVFNTDWFRTQPDPDAEKKLDSSARSGPFIKQGETRYASNDGRYA
ncbi:MULTISPECIES: cyclic GMP-AMP synthase DncV-like nucleotidyltransferase [Rhizobium]|uniref:Cyclic GMP-AMP synthase n=1 Tax=Rhizobium tropici TaxID=398 RepID=A0A329YHL3_RHITR|nr:MULTISPECIES: hypothetical protein [Rhizobium]MBX4913660.1 hypothetical protein [Rhizobium bangladeshense]RAX42508.1 hypothetical protein DQ393_06745 [Rhizobium tropici]